MKARNIFSALAILVTFMAPARSLEGNSLWSEEDTLLQDAKARLSHSKIESSVIFIENVGQFAEEARFQVKGSGRTIWLSDDSIWFVVWGEGETRRGGTEEQGSRGAEEISPLHPSTLAPLLRSGRGGAPLRPIIEGEESLSPAIAIKLSFPGSNPNTKLEPFKRLETVISFFKGNDPSNWHTNVPAWGGVRYKELYPGVDLVLEGEDGRIKMRWEAHPWADLEKLRLRVEGAKRVSLEGGNLVLATDVGEFSLRLPILEGAKGSPRVEVLPGEGGEIAYEVSSPWAEEEAFAFQTADDPSDLLYGTFIGGSDWDRGYGIAADGGGNAYVTGYTLSSDFPTTPGAFDTSLNGVNAFVVKLNPNGSSLLYGTFIGAGVGYGIAVDGLGNAYVTGGTDSSDFPTTPGAFDTSYNGRWDAFVVKLNPTGSSLIYGTFIGGSDDDDTYPGGDIAVDGGGNAYVTGLTLSSDFPTTSGAFDTSLGGEYDAFVVKLDPNGSSLVYGTFIGGSYYDRGSGIAVDGLGNAYVTGKTNSSDFPTTFDTSYNGGSDAFVVKLNPTGGSLIYGTFIGGSDDEGGMGIAVDGGGNAYVTGWTRSSDFPTTPGAFDTSFNGGYAAGRYDAFVVKLDQNGSSLSYGTFIGGSDWENGRGIAVDGWGNAYVTGATRSSGFPTTPGAFDTSYNGGYWGDAFVVKFNPDGSSLLYGTFIGGSKEDWGGGIAVDGGGNAYVIGETLSSDFPTTPGAFDTSHNGYYDAFVVKLRVGEAFTFTGTISPVWPESNTTLSTVMQGGTLYRHFRLLDSGGSPIPNATITLSTGGTAISDVSGYFTATVQADALGGLGSYIISVQSVSYGGQTYSTGGEPSFSVEVNERRYSYSWSYGAKSRLKGGVSAGLIAYLQRQTSGGLALILDESNPDITSDDVVLMKESFSDEIGAGGGVGIEKGVSIGILEIKGGASAVTEHYIRTLGNTTARFPNPYSENDRKAEAIFLLASVIDSLGQAFPGKPFAVGFLKLGLDRVAPYRDYISEQQAGFGAKITPIKANVGAGASLGLMRGGVTWKERLLGFDLVDLGVTVLTLNSFTDYRDRGEIGLGSEAEFDLDFSLLNWQIWEFRNKLAGTIGEKAKKIKLEVILDADTLDFKRLELSLTGEGNPLAFTDVLKEEVTVKAKIPAEELTWDVLLQTVNVLRLLQAAQETGYNPLKIGPSAMVNELNALLAPLGYVEYEVTVEDGAETSIETSLGVTFIIKIELGPGLEVKKVRSLVRERGVFINGHPYKTESYEADGYVSRPGKGWWDLTLNALSGLWELVKDAFSWMWEQVTSGVEWVIGTVSKLGGVIRGGARIIAPPGAQLYSPEPGLMASIQQTNPITVTVMGWVPTGVTASGLSPSLAIASGEDFVVGGIYEFGPASLTISPSATLVITYTDEAAIGVDETKLGIFRWDEEEHNWQLLSAQTDPAHNIFTATVSQLGTYALGYDGLPPNVSILSPEDGSTITNTLPLISALVTDRGVGINHGRVVMMLDGEIVAHSYITSTGQVSYLPPEPLGSGSHTVEVMAEDVVGNASASSATFTVEVVHHIYLPLVLKKW
jgi:hypothetical protein